MAVHESLEDIIDRSVEAAGWQSESWKRVLDAWSKHGINLDDEVADAFGMLYEALEAERRNSATIESCGWRAS